MDGLIVLPHPVSLDACTIMELLRLSSACSLDQLFTVRTSYVRPGNAIIDGIRGRE